MLGPCPGSQACPRKPAWASLWKGPSDFIRLALEHDSSRLAVSTHPTPRPRTPAVPGASFAEPQSGLNPKLSVNSSAPCLALGSAGPRPPDLLPLPSTAGLTAQILVTCHIAPPSDATCRPLLPGPRDPRRPEPATAPRCSAPARGPGQWGGAPVGPVAGGAGPGVQDRRWPMRRRACEGRAWVRG